MAVGVFLLLLSYPLATGRNWARRALVAALVFIGLFSAFWHGVRLFEFPKSFSHSSAEQSRLVSICILLGDLSSLVGVLTVILFGVVFLSHPDVIGTFRSGASPSEKV